MSHLIITPRLGLRNWTTEDVDDLFEVNRDPEVMRYFPATQDREATAAMVDRFRRHYDQHGFTYFAVDRLDTGECIGFTGLAQQEYDAYFTPCVDIGWRLKKSSWGKGYATEAARACLDYAFASLQLDKVFAVAVEGNRPSIRVMEKIGMQFDGTFQHPALVDHPHLGDCVVYQKEK